MSIITFNEYLAEASSSGKFRPTIFKKLIASSRKTDPINVKSIDVVNDIKAFLIKETKCADWRTFVNRCKFGQCDLISYLVATHFEGVEVVETSDIHVSNEAAKSTDESMNVFNHFFVKIGNTYYDFAKGALVDNGEYLLDPSKADLYKVTLNSFEKKEYITSKMYKREGYKFMQF